MNERQKRLIEVYEHLRKYYGIHTKTGFAEALHYGRTSMSAAMNGDEKYLTDNLFKTICEAYEGVFNLDYLLNGNGQLLTLYEEVACEKLEKQFIPKPIDQSSLVNAALAAKDDAIESLKRELNTKDELIKSLRDQLAAKDQLIAEQKARLIDYRRLIDSRELEKNYPFPVGVADEKHTKKRA
jgi:hypothetical protein